MVGSRQGLLQSSMKLKAIWLYEEEMMLLKHLLAAEKEKARKSWKTNCEHLADQDAIIMAMRRRSPSLRSR